MTNSIFCESCKQWSHASCENLCAEEMVTLDKSNFQYKCNQCFQLEVGEGEYSYHQGLLRLSEVSVVQTYNFWASSHGNPGYDRVLK